VPKDLDTVRVYTHRTKCLNGIPKKKVKEEQIKKTVIEQAK